jgi:hypothetical protein
VLIFYSLDHSSPGVPVPWDWLSTPSREGPTSLLVKAGLTSDFNTLDPKRMRLDDIYKLFHLVLDNQQQPNAKRVLSFIRPTSTEVIVPDPSDNEFEGISSDNEIEEISTPPQIPSPSLPSKSKATANDMPSPSGQKKAKMTANDTSSPSDQKKTRKKKEQPAPAAFTAFVPSFLLSTIASSTLCVPGETAQDYTSVQPSRSSTTCEVTPPSPVVTLAASSALPLSAPPPNAPLSPKAVSPVQAPNPMPPPTPRSAHLFPASATTTATPLPRADDQPGKLAGKKGKRSAKMKSKGNVKSSKGSACSTKMKSTSGTASTEEAAAMPDNSHKRIRHNDDELLVDDELPAQDDARRSKRARRARTIQEHVTPTKLVSAPRRVPVGERHAYVIEARPA